jgi:hypothetical protein
VRGRCGRADQSHPRGNAAERQRAGKAALELGLQERT